MRHKLDIFALIDFSLFLALLHSLLPVARFVQKLAWLKRETTTFTITVGVKNG